MNITKYAVGVGTAIVLFAAVPAFASVTQNYLTINDQSNAVADSIPFGQTYDAVLTETNTGNNTVQSIRVEIPNTQFPGECIDVGNQNTTGTHTISFTGNTNGATEGTHDVKITTYGKLSTQTGANNNCDPTIGVSSTHTFQDVLTITTAETGGVNANSTGGNSSGNNSGGSAAGSGGGTAPGVTPGSNGTAGSGTASSTFDTALSALQAQFASLLAQVQGLGNIVQMLAPDAICSQKPADTSALQNFFVGQGLMTAAEVATGPGIYGPKTTRANMAFNLMHKCHN